MRGGSNLSISFEVTSMMGENRENSPFVHTKMSNISGTRFFFLFFISVWNSVLRHFNTRFTVKRTVNKFIKMCKSIPLYILYFINGLPTILYKKRRNDNIQYTSTGFPPPLSTRYWSDQSNCFINIFNLDIVSRTTEIAFRSDNIYYTAAMFGNCYLNWYWFFLIFR